MNTKFWLLTAALTLTFLWWKTSGGNGAVAVDGLSYTATCEVLAPANVNGSVTNQSSDAYEVNGVVTFSFAEPGSAEHKDLSVSGIGLIPPGATVVVAHASLPFIVGAGKECLFSVTGALGKVRK